MYLRSTKVIAQPEVEPVSLAEAKAQVGLLQEQEDDNGLLLLWIATARTEIEKRLGCALAAKRLRAVYSKEQPQSPLAYSGLSSLLGFGGFGGYGGVGAFPYPSAYPTVADPRDMRLPAPPLLVDADHPLVVQLDGVTVDPGQYVIDADSMPAVLRFLDEPVVAPRGTMTVLLWSGPAPGERISPILRSVILLTVGHLYRNREATTESALRELPLGIEMMLAAESITGAY
ncbi:gp6 domain containing protein [uncultured Caudovirales phage]|uniref:Gp6 domain containing protein n=1 Tax=uncultured Caudovirales phage TaxID=2100421 RepID=A0A6J5QPR2_9CAUD|nr:gp6 domain containing protein [uncultured Caudovirales phage]